MYKTDYSNCCSSRKRKVSVTKDTEFDVAVELGLTKKSKKEKSKGKANAAKSILNTEEQEEVVCAPDLLSLMGDYDHTETVNPDFSNLQTSPPIPPYCPIMPSYSRSSPPPLFPAPPRPPAFSMLNNYRLMSPVILPQSPAFVQNPARSSVIMQTPHIDTAPKKQKQALVQNPASMVKTKGKQIILNTTLKNPITTQNIGNLTGTVEKVSTHKITLKNPHTVGSRLAPGSNYEWFDAAAKSSIDIQTKLSVTISQLSSSRERATTMEDLAEIHNRFQESLSNSINSMIQIRKSLRNEFLASLNNLKFIKTVQNPREDDDDVVFVKSLSPTQQHSLPPPQPPPPSSSLNNKSHGPYLKVRSVSQLLNLPSECITIPDEVIEKITENKKEEDAKKRQEQKESKEDSCDISNDSNKENVDRLAANSIEIIDNDSTNNTETNDNIEKSEQTTTKKRQPENDDIARKTRKAIFEKKIEKLVKDNLKYNVKGVRRRDLHRWLSARVYVSEKKRHY